jgi:mannose-1-phosphate guanylyltransferase
MSNRPTHAFVLGAGLGTRLRPLTQSLPKPLVPVGGKPLVHYALQHLARLGISDAIINTHHAAEQWQKSFPTQIFEGMKLTFRHEPTLLDTGGGLKNVEDFLTNHGTFIIYNGDILTSLPLQQAFDHHQRQKNLVTMVLRSREKPHHVSLNSEGRVVDIRGLLGTGKEGEFLFTGIHIVEPKLFEHIPTVQIRSVIRDYLDLIRQGLPIGGVVLDEGVWFDLGTMEEYQQVNDSITKGELKI